MIETEAKSSAGKVPEKKAFSARRRRTGREGDAIDRRRDDLVILSLSGLLGLFISFASLVLVLVAIAIMYHPAIDLSGVSDIFVPPVEFFSPEPVERIQYVAGAFLFPIILFASTLIIYRRLKGNVKNIRKMRLAYDALLGVFFALALLLAWYGIRKVDDNLYLSKDYFFTHHAIAGVVLALIVLFVAARDTIEGAVKPANKVLRAVGLLLALAIISLVEFLPVMNRYTMGEEPFFTDHFNAVFHAVAQVYSGKALLIDLVHQYGLYPQFLEPILQVTGLSILRFTIVMGFLLGLSLIAVYLFLNEALKSKAVLFLGFSAFVFYSYFDARIILGFDPYFQVEPIRTFFPFLGIYVAWRYFLTGKRKWYYANFVLGGLAILWNADTGIIVFLTWLLALCYQEMAGKDVRAVVKAVTTHAVTALAVFVTILLLFTFYMYVRYGEFPAYGELFSYQQTFYMYGFYMLPMPLFRPWNIITLAYMIGLMLAVKALVYREVTPRSRMFFYLSVLGVGIFSYYQGRSHDAVLTAVWYPAILLLIMFADDLWAYTKVARRDPVRNAMLVVILFVFSAGLFNLLPNAHMVRLVTVAKERALVTGPTLISSNADMIKSWVTPGERVLILSYNSGFYYMESKTTSPLSLPGPSEIVLRRDFEAIDDYIVTANADKIIFDRNYINHNGDWLIGLNTGLYEDLRRHYDQAATSPSGNIILFGRRAGG